MSTPDYTVKSISVEGEIKHSIHWRAKMEPEFTFDTHPEAQDFCDQLNADGPVHISSKAWNWIDATKQIPDDDIEVLVLTRSERLIPAVHRSGHWYPAYGPTGQRLSSAAITHWIHPIYPQALNLKPEQPMKTEVNKGKEDESFCH